MSSIAKRVDKLEQGESKPAKQGRHILFVEYASDGGLMYYGKFYSSTDALLQAKGYGPDEALFMGRKSEQTASELLAEAAERAKNPPPSVTVDDLGEYGRRLVEQEGLSPAVAALLEKHNSEMEACREQK